MAEEISPVAIVPAYNESYYIGKVLSGLNECKRLGLLKEIIVVNDGSGDGTAAIAKRAGATVISFEKNRGKARAFEAGVRLIAEKYAPKSRFGSQKERLAAMESVFVLSFDADLGEVTPQQVKAMIDALAAADKENVKMIIGERKPFGQYLSMDSLNGERAIRLRSLQGMLLGTKKWKQVLEIGYGLETALNSFFRFRFAKTGFVIARAPEGMTFAVRKHMQQAADLLSKRQRIAREASEERKTGKKHIWIPGMKIRPQRRKG